MTSQGPDFAEDIARLHERGELERLRAALAKSEAEIERLVEAMEAFRECRAKVPA